LLHFKRRYGEVRHATWQDDAQDVWVNFLRLIWIILIFLSLTACVTDYYDQHGQPITMVEVADVSLQAQSRISLALAYLEQQNLVLAKINLDKAWRLDPHKVELHLAYAAYYEVIDDQAQAEDHYQQALEVASEQGVVLSQYGMFLCRHTKLTQGLSLLKSALMGAQAQKIALYYENLGLCAYKAGLVQDAQTYLNKAKMFDPTRHMPYIALSSIALAQNDMQKLDSYILQVEKQGLKKAEALRLVCQLDQTQADANQCFVEQIRRFPILKGYNDAA
tara:strand:+ start:142 stop:972 length:831 start_codon:yes stop_codon:yes gene_type:complete